MSFFKNIRISQAHHQDKFALICTKISSKGLNTQEMLILYFEVESVPRGVGGYLQSTLTYIQICCFVSIGDSFSIC